MVIDPLIKKEVINMLKYNLMDNVNSYVMKEDGTYEVKKYNSKNSFNVHKEFFKVSRDEIKQAALFE
jgi:polyphosphate kinase